MVLVALATLLMAALLIMFSFSRKAVKEEAVQKAEQTLEATIQHIDNILLSVEQASGNIYWKILNHPDQPDKTELYCKKLVEENPYIVDCTVIMDSTFNAIDTNVPCWTEYLRKDSLKDNDITSFCLPIYLNHRKAGMLVADVSLTMLSKIVSEAKPSPNSYCTLLGNNGTFILHPDSSLLKKYAFTLTNRFADPSIREVAEAMVEGDTGYQHVNMNGKDCFVFYKPFERKAAPGRFEEKLGWSIAIVYPENDIFGDYNKLLYIVLIIAVVGLMLLLVLCQSFIHHQLAPLRLLSKYSQRIAEGDYNNIIPNSKHTDEVGRLQGHFQQMQLSLSTRVGEMKHLSETLQERGEELQAVYDQAQAAERMKTNFLYNMSNQMMAPIRSIYKCVMKISKEYSELSEEDTNLLVDEIKVKGDKITEMLNQLITDSEKQMK